MTSTRSLKAFVGQFIRGFSRAPSALTPEAVRWAYRLLLGREPENQEVIQRWLQQLNSIDELRKNFMRSEEFRLKNAFGARPTLTGDEAQMPIDDVSSEADVQRLFTHIQDTWQHFGETEPHWSVLTAEMFSQENIGQTSDAFYASGEYDVKRFFHTLARNGLASIGLSSCLEYGCGVGRVTSWLAKNFNHVTGCDISRAHLQLAERYLKETGLANVSLKHLSSLTDVKSLPKVDVVFSAIVLQHNPPPVIQIILIELIRALNPGGVAYFQVPTFRAGYQFRLNEYLATDGAQRTMEMHVLPQSIIFDIIAREGGRVIEVLEDGFTGSRYKEVSDTFLVQKQ